jgi:methyl-accepting chemotaxis protein
VLGDRLLKVNEDINKSSKNSIKDVEQVNMSLSQLADDLKATVNSSGAKIAGVMKDYDKYIADFNTVTAEASSGVFEINNLIASQSDKMIKISEDTKQLVECFCNLEAVQLVFRFR